MEQHMASYDTIIPRVLMQVQPCPQFVVLDAVQHVSVDFFTRTEVWMQTFAETLYRGTSTVDITADRGAVVSRIIELMLDGARLEERADFNTENAGKGVCIIFRAPCMDGDHTLYANCSLHPEKTATQAPEALLKEWGDTLVFGALAKIKSMSGPRVGWSDPQAAQMNLSLYEQGVAQARIKVAGYGGWRRLTGRPRNRGDI